jgi:hypothetical protein
MCTGKQKGPKNPASVPSVNSTSTLSKPLWERIDKVEMEFAKFAVGVSVGIWMKTCSEVAASYASAGKDDYSSFTAKRQMEHRMLEQLANKAQSLLRPADNKDLWHLNAKHKTFIDTECQIAHVFAWVDEDWFYWERGASEWMEAYDNCWFTWQGHF